MVVLGLVPYLTLKANPPVPTGAGVGWETTATNTPMLQVPGWIFGDLFQIPLLLILYFSLLPQKSYLLLFTCLVLFLPFLLKKNVISLLFLWEFHDMHPNSACLLIPHILPSPVQ